MKIYVYTDCVLGQVTFKDNNDVWRVNTLDWEKLIKVLLTPKQYRASFENDFYGDVYLRQYKAAKTLYQSFTKP